LGGTPSRYWELPRKNKKLIKWLGSVAETNVSLVKYELGFYIPEDDILHSDCSENLKSYIALTGWTL
jgi:hypothetical protein